MSLGLLYKRMNLVREICLNEAQPLHRNRTKVICLLLSYPPTGTGKSLKLHHHLSHLADWLDPKHILGLVPKALRISTPAGKAAGHYHIKLPLLLHISN